MDGDKKMNGTFNAALRRIDAFEGEVSNHPFDPGGFTYRGISRHYYPNWEGWIYLDNEHADKLALNSLVRQFYKEEYWDKINGNALSRISDSVAIEVFEIAVNFHIPDAVRCLQIALNRNNRNAATYPDIMVDGLLGPQTLKTLERYLQTKPGTTVEREQILLNCMNGEQYILYISNPTHEMFRGWFKRV